MDINTIKRYLIGNLTDILMGQQYECVLTPGHLSQEFFMLPHQKDEANRQRLFDRPSQF
jgi:hypothetical protein